MRVSQTNNIYLLSLKDVCVDEEYVEEGDVE
jgi:hypothetical protein